MRNDDSCSRRAVWSRMLTSCALGLLPATALAAGAFDTAAARVSEFSARTLSWTHHLGAEANRVLVVGVVLEDKDNGRKSRHHHWNDPDLLPKVTFNKIPMSPVPEGVAIASGHNKHLRTQLFYLLDASLPPAGAYRIKVRLKHRVDGLAGGSISLSGLAQAAPESVAIGTSSHRAKEVTTSLTTLSRQAWIVEAVSADVGSHLFPVGADQVKRYAARGRGMSIAGGASVAAEPGTRDLTWETHGRGLLAHVAAAFAPVTYPLTVQIIGAGNVEPSGGSFLEGEVVELTAVPTPGHRFVGWSGDLTGTSNPAQLTMDAPKSVTATFIDVHELVTTIDGEGTIDRDPDATVYDDGAIVTLTATPADGWRFVGWSGDLSGTDNPTSVLMDSNKTVTATFVVMPLHDLFSDGERDTQTLPESAAWFTSSGSNNLIASPGQLQQIVSSSRTFLAYFTDDPAAPLTFGSGQTLTLNFSFRFTGFDTGSSASSATFRVGLLRSVANPEAESGKGFEANGPPNTNARVIGDFGSNNPSTNVFSLYTGYGAFTSANEVGTSKPVRFYARTGSAKNLLNSTSPYTEIPVGTPTPSEPMEAGVDYRGVFRLEHTGGSIVLSYEVARVSDGAVVMSHAVEDAGASMTAFDTVAFYVSKNSASATYDIILTEAQVVRTGVAPVTYPLFLAFSGTGGGSVMPTPGPGPYAPGTVVTLTATPDADSVFTGWSGDLSGDANPTTITMDSPKSVTAEFTFVVSDFTLMVYTIGSGSVLRNPDLPAYPPGSSVELTAVPEPGWTFVGWSGGGLSGTDSPILLVMDGDRHVTARFIPESGGAPDFELYGWATENGGTTGGEGGPEVVVDTLADLKLYASEPGPYVVKIYGTISGNEQVRVRSNKSILGIGDDARLLGIGLQIGWSSEFGQIGNVIIRNITFEKALAPIDNIYVGYGAHNVWIDHCDFFSDRDHGVDYYDGLLDITHAADFVTISWSRFYEHYKTSLIGHNDNNAAEDEGHLTITYHHNSFNNSGGRNPSVRFGLVHVYNNDYRDIDDYGIASRMEAEVVIENNWFENVNRPIRADTSLSDVAGYVSGVDTNMFVDCTPNSITSLPATWLPPYAYGIDPVADVPELVGSWAGVGIVVFEGEPPPPTPPTITAQPVSQTVVVGDDAGFSVTVAGSEPFTYQWYKDGSPISGATEAILSLTNVQEADAGSYDVVVSNAGGSVTSDPAILTVDTAPPPPPPPPPADPLHDLFTDGERNTQALPDSAAWFTSSGSGNLVASTGQLRQIVSSSRTFLAYFTDYQAAPLTLGAGQTLTLNFNFQFTGFDSAVDPSSLTFRAALLRSVANPDATSGSGFVANGPPNTNARVSGDYGSNGPGSNVFALYSGYGAFTSANEVGTDTPIRFYARTGSSATLLGTTSSSVYTQITVGTPTPSAAMEAGAAYRGTLILEHTGDGIMLSYIVSRISDGFIVMSHSVEDTSASMTEFDTVGFYLSKNSASPTYDFILTEVEIIRTDS